MFIYIAERSKSNGGSRYECMDEGCGCCCCPAPLSLHEAEKYLAHLKEMFPLCEKAIEDMKANGENYPYVCQDD